VIYPQATDGAAVRWLDVAGTRIRCVEAGDGAAPPVVLLPGWGCSAYSFRHNLPALARGGFRAIAIEPPGQGWSHKPVDEGSYTLRSLAESVIAALDALGIERAPIIGQSLGGGVALQIALDARDRTERLILWSPIGFGCVRVVYHGRGLPLSLAPAFERLAGPQLVRLMLKVIYGKSAPPVARDVEQYSAPIGSPGFVRSQLALLRNVRWRPLSATELRRLNLPVFIVAGAKDPLVPLSCLAEAESSLPDGRLHVVASAGHAANETHAAEVNRQTLAFLRVPDGRATG
jgi:4,5:9,10-diseco-3-hydroxy-5,9,17-trioxoandrosta-1(10),2-diene-4-oate hydrolase